MISALRWVASVGDKRLSDKYNSWSDWFERRPAASKAIGRPEREQVSKWRHRRLLEDRSARDSGANAVSGIIALNILVNFLLEISVGRVWWIPRGRYCKKATDEKDVTGARHLCKMFSGPSLYAPTFRAKTWRLSKQITKINSWPLWCTELRRN